MIQLHCTHCKAALSIDDAFAGGVCRCQFCGTIQTVPKRLKNGAAEGMPAKAAVGGSSKPLYKNKLKGDVGVSSGLDALGDVVASSGLSNSGLTSNAARRVKPSPAIPVGPVVKNKMIPILVVAGIVIILLLGVVIGMLMKNSGGDGKGDTPTQTHTTPALTVDPTTPAIDPVQATLPKDNTPVFFGVKLAEPSIIFVLDRGSATHDSFEAMKNACLNTLDSLRPNQKCQVIFWKLDKESDVAVYPWSLTAASNKSEIQKAEKLIDYVNCFGVSDIKPALEKAFAANPAVIVIATGKPLDGNFAKTVLDARQDSNVKVHCLSLLEANSRAEMEEVTRKTGGTYKFVSMVELRSVSR